MYFNVIQIVLFESISMSDENEWFLIPLNGIEFVTEPVRLNAVNRPDKQMLVNTFCGIKSEKEPIRMNADIYIYIYIYIYI